jgi:hypothetical protein
MLLPIVSQISWILNLDRYIINITILLYHFELFLNPTKGNTIIQAI